ncbi:uncharacterized protein B0H18DRAFT_877418 [Fomitopsis serialis]|uniref:uncharacterized protein n=1 Tax=Fomitopsis serialis TaxID=139415 RepID=UPI0020089F62|nr:uncharacterized protein B0H18DRAFT_877418 [Neoantrodia serialis]KAH9925129.1 hypothetical protein B0H18DRAFT_877418 [Neoantrodia serialis]
MSGLQLNRKRPRAESSDFASQPKGELRRDDEYWFEDGNIIIVAQEVGFRVYKGLLAMKSEVFRDMFSLPQPAPNPGSSRGETSECPIVHVTDTAAEIRLLLASHLTSAEFVSASHTFDDIANGVRMGHKYGNPTLLKYSLERLERYYPADPSKWDRLGQDPYGDPHAIVAVILARLANTQSVLTPALYACCQLDGKTLVEGRVRLDGIVDMLSPEDLVRCIDGKARLWSYLMETVDEAFRPIRTVPCPDTDGRCDHSFALMRREWMSSTRRVGGACNVLRPWKTDIQALVDTHQYPLCRFCTEMLYLRAESIRKRSLSKLAQQLGVDAEP